MAKLQNIQLQMLPLSHYGLIMAEVNFEASFQKQEAEQQEPYLLSIGLFAVPEHSANSDHEPRGSFYPEVFHLDIGEGATSTGAPQGRLQGYNPGQGAGNPRPMSAYPQNGQGGYPPQPNRFPGTQGMPDWPQQQPYPANGMPPQMQHEAGTFWPYGGQYGGGQQPPGSMHPYGNGHPYGHGVQQPMPQQMPPDRYNGAMPPPNDHGYANSFAPQWHSNNGYQARQGPQPSAPVADNRAANHENETFLFWITREPMLPVHQEKSIQRQAMFDPRYMPAGIQNYRAYVWLIPERTKGPGWSNSLSS